jgi:peptide/nickel transport system substrate-binding protein
MQGENQYWRKATIRRLSRRTVLTGTAALAAAGGLATIGCGGRGGSSGSGSASNGGSAGAGTAAAPSAGKFKSGGTIQRQFDGPIGLDPFENSSYRAQHLAGMSYSRLFGFNASTDPKVTLSREPVPDLVASYETTPDGLTYTMKLKQGVMFHPPLSRALTSEDVTASFQRFTTDAKNTNAAIFKNIVDNLSAPDAQTLVFKLKAPYAPFLNVLANPQYLWIMSKDAAGGQLDPSKDMVGTGPWIYVSGSPTAYTFKKNPDYFVKGIPYADGAVLNIVPDYATREAQFQAGKIDVDFFPPTDVDSMKKAVPKAQVVSYVRNLLHFLFFTNVSSPDSPFHDVRMRRAASLALDRDGILDLFYGGHAPWPNFINPGLGKWWLDPQGKDIGDAGRWYKHDPAQAKQLIAQAGHADTQFRFIYANNAYSDPFNPTSDAIRGMLSDAGFKLTVVTVDYQKDYINNGQGIYFKGAPPNSIVSALETPFTDPDDYIFNMLSSASTRNHESVNDPALEDLIKQERAATEDSKRLPLVQQIQKLVSDQMYYPPVIATPQYWYVQPWVQNFFPVDDYADGTEQFAYSALNK